MNLFITCIVWTWLLSISLIVPTALPAGGAKKSIIEYSENNPGSELIALKAFNLLTSVDANSSILTGVQVGTPFKILKVWNSPKSGKWLLVNVLTESSSQIFHKRGWVRIGFS